MVHYLMSHVMSQFLMDLSNYVKSWCGPPTRVACGSLEQMHTHIRHVVAYAIVQVVLS